MTEEIRHTEKRFARLAMMTAIFIGIFFVLMGYKALAKGLILGSLFSVANFILIGEILPLMIGYSRKKSSALSFFSIILRHGLLAIPLIIALKWDHLDFAATVVGLFMVQIVILGRHVFKSFSWIRSNEHRKNVSNG